MPADRLYDCRLALVGRSSHSRYGLERDEVSRRPMRDHFHCLIRSEALEYSALEETPGIAAADPEALMSLRENEHEPAGHAKVFGAIAAVPERSYRSRRRRPHRARQDPIA